MNKHFRPRSTLERKANEVKRGLAAIAYYQANARSVQLADANKNVLAGHRSNPLGNLPLGYRELPSQPVKETDAR